MVSVGLEEVRDGRDGVDWCPVEQILRPVRYRSSIACPGKTDLELKRYVVREGRSEEYLKSIWF